MHIRGLNVQRALNNLIDPLDHRRLTGKILEVLDKLRVIDIKGSKSVERLFLVALGIAL